MFGFYPETSIMYLGKNKNPKHQILHTLGISGVYEGGTLLSSECLARYLLNQAGSPLDSSWMYFTREDKIELIERFADRLPLIGKWNIEEVEKNVDDLYSLIIEKKIENVIDEFIEDLK